MYITSIELELASKKCQTDQIDLSSRVITAIGIATAAPQCRTRSTEKPRTAHRLRARSAAGAPMSLDPAHFRYRAFEHSAWERAAANYADSFATVTALFARPLLDAAGCDAGLQVLDVARGSGFISSLVASMGGGANRCRFQYRHAGPVERAIPSHFVSRGRR